jgi:hypothetical protein
MITKMDSLMSGYGLNKQGANNATPPGYQNNAVLDSTSSSSKSSNQIKKQLTLSEKQEMASRLERDDLQNGHNTISTSSSMSSIKKKPDLAESLMDRNLADLNINSTQQNNQFKSNHFSPQQTQQLSLQPTPFNMPTTTSTTNNNFNKQASFNPVNRSNQQPPFPSMSNQQMGFFGNLALPAPPTASSINNTAGFNHQGPSLNSMKSMSNQIGQVMTPSLIPPPPGANNKQQLQPTISSQANKKSALDDLQDIFG